MKERGYIKVVVTLITIILIFVAVVSIRIYRYGNISYTGKADGAIVLGAAVWEDEPSPVFEERIKHGIWLYKNSRVGKLIFTGGKSKGDTLSEGEVGRRYAIENSIPPDDILIEEKSTITQENLYYAKEVGKRNGLETFIIVSDPLHMKRAMILAKDYDLEAYPSPTPTTRYKTWRSKSKFLAREVYFYIGYLVYRILPIDMMDI